MVLFVIGYITGVVAALIADVIVHKRTGIKNPDGKDVWITTNRF